MFAGGEALTCRMARCYADVGAQRVVDVFDVGAVATVDMMDGIHFGAEAHCALGLALIERLQR